MDYIPPINDIFSSRSHRFQRTKLSQLHGTHLRVPAKTPRVGRRSAGKSLLTPFANFLSVPYFCSPLSSNCMKKSIHPEYKEVIFWDTSSDFKFLSRSTSIPKESMKWTDGKEYPVIKVEVSSASHPFFTGKKMFVDTAGRVEKFKNKYQKKA